MAVIKAEIEAKIVALIKSNKNSDDADAAIKEFADGMSKIITDAIRSATIVVPAGIPVQTVPVTGTGASVAPITAKIT